MPETSVELRGSASDADGTVVAYRWTQQSGPGNSTLGGQHTATLGASDLGEGVYVFRLTVSDDDGDSAFDEVQVTVKTEAGLAPRASSRELKIKKYFSPDGNGINDFWEIENLDLYQEPALIVFNRSGQVVFEQKSYANNWRGTTSSGNPLPDGDYYFILKLTDFDDPIAGAVRIIRYY
jgi:gliding motility-associated-like protein